MTNFFVNFFYYHLDPKYNLNYWTEDKISNLKPNISWFINHFFLKFLSIFYINYLIIALKLQHKMWYKIFYYVDNSMMYLL